MIRICKDDDNYRTVVYPDNYRVLNFLRCKFDSLQLYKTCEQLIANRLLLYYNLPLFSEIKKYGFFCCSNPAM